MTTADNVIRRLAELNPVPHVGPSGLEEAAEAERVLRRVLTSPQRRRVPFSTAGARALTAALTAIAIAVAASALILLGHHQRLSAPIALGGGSTRQQLIRTFAVLRTAPTATDLRLSKCIEQAAPNLARARVPLSAAKLLRCGGGLPGGFLIAPGRQAGESAQYLKPSLARGWQPQLLRTVTLPRWGDVVTLMPLSFEPSSSHQRTEGLLASVAHRQSSYGLGGSGPTSLSWLQSHGVAISLYLGNAMNRDVNRDVVIVPDDVARVTLGSFRIPMRGAFRALHGIASVSARVHDNVAALQLKTPIVRSAGQTGVVAADGIADATWYDASGNFIARTTTPLTIYVKGSNDRGGSGHNQP